MNYSLANELVISACRSLEDLSSSEGQDICVTREAIYMLRSCYKESLMFRALFDNYFLPGSMMLVSRELLKDECEKLIFNVSAMLRLICRKYGVTERERKRLVETRNFFVADICLNFRDREIIEIGGLQIPFIIECIQPKTYIACTNKGYAEMYHKSHNILLVKHGINDSSRRYIEENFEDIDFEVMGLSERPIVYSSNAIEHIQRLESVLEHIYRLGAMSTAYLVFGPIRSHSQYGHHSSYEINDVLLRDEDINCFHLLSLSKQFEKARRNHRRHGKSTSDSEILDILSKSITSSRQLLNNLSESDYLRIFNCSNLYICRYDVLLDFTVQLKSNMRELYSEQPQIGNIGVRNIRTILARDLMYFAENYPEQSSQINPQMTHWLQQL